MCTDPTSQAPDAPGTRRLTAGPLELTTPPRGPVFPGEPWKKKLGRSEMSSPGKGGPLAPCSSWSNPTPRPTAAQTWPLSLSSLPWYLISFDAWQALGSWNSWGALLSFGALRWGKKTKQCSKLKNPVVSPLPPSAGLSSPVVLEGLAALLVPFHPGHPEMQKGGRTWALSRASLLSEAGL